MARRRITKPIVGQGVSVRGLEDFHRQLKRIESEAGADGLGLLKALNYDVAEHIRVRAVARAQGLTRMQRRAASTLRSSKQARRALITGGSDAKSGVAFFGGAEFGAAHDSMRFNIGGSPPRSGLGWNQFPDWRGNHGAVGYFLFPTLRAESETIKEMYWQGLERIVARAFPD